MNEDALEFDSQVLIERAAAQRRALQGHALGADVLSEGVNGQTSPLAEMEGNPALEIGQCEVVHSVTSVCCAQQ